MALPAAGIGIVKLLVVAGQSLNRGWTSEHPPLPTAPPTSSLPSGRSGGSAAGLPTLPFTFPRASEMIWMPPRMPSPLKVTCTSAHQTSALSYMPEFARTLFKAFWLNALQRCGCSHAWVLCGEEYE